MKTYQPTQKEVKRDWHLLDADGQILGRISTQIATFLTGKHKVKYSTHMDMGDNVVVLNVEKIVVTGKKSLQKVYSSHSGYPGGYKEKKYGKVLTEHPERILMHAVSGMIPDNRLKAPRMARLKLVVGDKNPFKEKFETTVVSKAAEPNHAKN